MPIEGLGFHSQNISIFIKQTNKERRVIETKEQKETKEQILF